MSFATFCSQFGICSRAANGLVESVCGVVAALRVPREGVHAGCVPATTTESGGSLDRVSVSHFEFHEDTLVENCPGTANGF